MSITIEDAVKCIAARARSYPIECGVAVEAVKVTQVDIG